MHTVEDPALRQSILDILIKEYQLLEPRTGIHASDLIYCLTRSYWNKVDYLPPTELDLMRFSIGLGLERVIVQHEASRVDPIEFEGIWLSPDFLLDGIHSELKTTRWGPQHPWADTWIKQVLAYCKAVDTPVYNLAVIHIIQAALRVYRIFVSTEEVESNWSWMMERKIVLASALGTTEPPQEFTFNEPWECDGCRYKLRCDLSASLRTPSNVVPLRGAKDVDDSTQA